MSNTNLSIETQLCAAVGRLALLALLVACSHDGETLGSSGRTSRTADVHAPNETDDHAHARADEHDHAHGDAPAGGSKPADGGASAHGDEHAHADEVALSPAALAASRIELGTASTGALAVVVRAPAQIALNREGMAHVGCPVKGRVAELAARLGADVKSGDVLAVVESAEFAEAQSDYLAKTSAAATAAPAVELARNAHERAQGLYAASQGIALTEVQKREAELHVAEAALAAARTAVRAAESRLTLLGFDGAARARLAEKGDIDARFLVRAPIAGQVVERGVALGELVGPERDALFVLADTRELWVLADVPEARLRDVAVGARARVLLGAEEDHWCQGVVNFVSPALDARTRTVRVRIQAIDHHPELRPGVFAEAEIEAPRSEGVELVVVPSEAVREVEGARVVFVPVAGEEGTFAARRVEVAATAGGKTQLRAGLAAGERYVAKGAFVLEAELGKSSAVHEH